MTSLFSQICEIGRIRNQGNVHVESTPPQAGMLAARMMVREKENGTRRSDRSYLIARGIAPKTPF